MGTTAFVGSAASPTSRRAGEHYVSVYESTNADLDSGELKEAALGVSKLLKTGAVFTSLYDSDSYEFVVFNNDRQIDLRRKLLGTTEAPDEQVARNAVGKDFRELA